MQGAFFVTNIKDLNSESLEHGYVFTGTSLKGYLKK
jgi:hypothetical protein